MAVMPAGVHHARPAGGIGQAAGFLDRQRVHVRPQGQHRAVVPASQNAGDAMPGQARSHIFEAQRAQAFGDQRRRLRFLAAEFRVLVQMTAGFDDFGENALNGCFHSRFNVWHERGPFRKSTAFLVHQHGLGFLHCLRIVSPRSDNEIMSAFAFHRRAILIGLLLVLITAAVFHDTLQAGFVRWDDGMHVYANPFLHPISVSNAARFWAAPYQNLYVPVSYSLYALLAAMAHLPAPVPTIDGLWVDLNPRVFHGASLLLHLANVLLVFALLRRLLPSPRTAGSDWAAGAGRLLFAVHPVQVESVAWISEMRGLLSGLFSLLALHAYLRYSESRSRRTLVYDSLPFALCWPCCPSRPPSLCRFWSSSWRL